MRSLLRTGLALFLVLSFFPYFFIASPASANGVTPDHYVDATGNNTAPYDTAAKAAHSIQDAIDAAASTDKVHVAAGTYNEDITLKDGVEVLGAGADNTTINGTGTGPVVTSENLTSTAKLDGFTITNGSSATGGGGMYNLNSSPTVSNCIFSNNAAITTSGYGGGMYNYNSDPTVTNCTFSNNSATRDAGSAKGGGMYNYESDPTVTGCNFSNNTASGGMGGGMYNYKSSPTVSSCNFSGNSAWLAGGMMNEVYSAAAVTGCNFTGNSATTGTGSGGGMLNSQAAPTVTSCTFSGNSAGEEGGGMANSLSYDPIHHSHPIIINCTFHGNSAPDGGGMHNDTSDPTVTNCTFYGNSAGTSGGGIYNYDLSDPVVTNCILWGDTAPSNAEIYKDGTSTITITYSDIQGGYTGTGNINSNPVFFNVAAGDYRLSGSSPCIDIGNDSATGIPATDFEGDPRIWDGNNDSTDRVDMGADEFYYVNVAPDAPVSPLCEGMTNPTRVGYTPEFSWTFSDNNTPLDTQGAYQVLVASTSGNLTIDNGDLWDSGQVSSSDNVTTYAGDALAPGQTCYWKVKTWDYYDTEGDYCTEQQFTTTYAPDAPVSPLCEGVTNPAGVTDPNPEFSWTFSDPDAGDIQGAYQILVASTSGNLTLDNGNMWNSGKVSGSANVISYAGTTFAENQTYYWKVKTWDESDIEGDYCAEQQFTTDALQYEVWVDDNWAGLSHGAPAGSHIFGTDAFATIQDGIDVVSFNGTADSIVHVAPGTYHEQVFLNKSYLSVQSTDGPDTTIIDGTGVTDSSPPWSETGLVWLQEDCISFVGFTLQNYQTDWGDGAVIWVDDYQESLGIAENRVNGSPPGVHGIYAGYGASDIHIVDNQVINTGGDGIRINEYSEYARIEGNEIINSGGDGIQFTIDEWEECDWLIISNNTVTDAAYSGICVSPDEGDWETNIDHADISGNEISGGRYGISIIYVEVDDEILIEGNNIHDVVEGDVESGEGVGIEIYDSEYVHMLGNTVQGNNCGIYIEGDYSVYCYANDNNIAGNLYCGVAEDDLDDTFDATHNWWGDASGPYHEDDNPGGAGNPVYGDVDFSDWYGAPVSGATSQDTATGNVTVDATGDTDTQVLKSGSGTPTVTITKNTGNPGGSAPGGFTAAGKYIDVRINDDTNVDSIEIRNYYTLADISGLNEATLKLSWWDGSAWIECSDSGATYPAGGPTYRGYIWAIITDNTTPTLADLTGTPFMSMGVQLPSAPPSYGGGGMGGGYRLNTDVLGVMKAFLRSYSGSLEEDVTLTSSDGVLSIHIPQGTLACDKSGKGLDTLEVNLSESPPPPPQDSGIIGVAYDFQPAGATFDPPITITVNYDSADIPAGLAEDSLVLAYYDAVAGEWVACSCTCNMETGCVTAQVSHFTQFALIAGQLPPSPPSFMVADLAILPSEVGPGEQVTVTISITNTGGTDGVYVPIFTVNGIAQSADGIFVAAGSTVTVDLTVSGEEPDVYNVKIAGLEGSFTVKSLAPKPPAPKPSEPAPKPLPPSPEEPTVTQEPEAVVPPAPETNWVLIGIIAAAVVVVILITTVLVRRRYR